MPVETLKDALSAGWPVRARCLGGEVGYTRSTPLPSRAEPGNARLDARAQHAAGGPPRPHDASRYGNRRMNLKFEPPPVAGRAQGQS